MWGFAAAKLYVFINPGRVWVGRDIQKPRLQCTGTMPAGKWESPVRRGILRRCFGFDGVHFCVLVALFFVS